MQKLRFSYKKTGRMKYLSHLDMMRVITRALTVSKLPFWITEGFNPHIYLNFLLPLPLGVESEREFCDFKFLPDESYENAAEKINKYLPGGIEILAFYPQKADAESIKKAEYLFEIETGKEIKAELGVFLKEDKMPILKRGKKKNTEINLKDFLENVSVSYEDDMAKVLVTLPAGQESNVNPLYFITVFDAFNKKECFYRIKRQRLLTENGTEFE